MLPQIAGEILHWALQKGYKNSAENLAKVAKISLKGEEVPFKIFGSKILIAERIAYIDNDSVCIDRVNFHENTLFTSLDIYSEFCLIKFEKNSPETTTPTTWSKLEPTFYPVGNGAPVSRARPVELEFVKYLTLKFVEIRTEEMTARIFGEAFFKLDGKFYNSRHLTSPNNPFDFIWGLRPSINSCAEQSEFDLETPLAKKWNTICKHYE